MNNEMLINGKHWYDLESWQRDELYLLGAIMLDEKALPIIQQFITAEDFECVENHTCFIGILELANAAKEITEMSLCKLLQSQNKLAMVGGALFVSRLADFCPSLTTLESNARAFRAAAFERLGIRELALMPDRISSGSMGLEDVAVKLMKYQADDAQRARNTKQEVQDALLTLSVREEHPGELLGLTSGYPELDSYTNGWQRGDLVIIAARPSMGKTAFALNLALQAIVLGKRVLMFSLEMSKQQLLMRLFAADGQISQSRMKNGSMNTEDWRRIQNSAKRLADSQLLIEDAGTATAAQILARAQIANSITPLDLVIVDYLQLMHGVSAKDKNREREVAEISRDLKQLARKLSVPVIALSQLNRAVEGRTSKRPGLADLRESGALEQDADIVAFIYRDEVYDPKSPDKGIAEIIVSKNRNGEIGTAKLLFKPDLSRFENLHEPTLAEPKKHWSDL